MPLNHIYNGYPKHPLHAPGVAERPRRRRLPSWIRALLQEARQSHPDPLLIFLTACLLAIGLVMVYSASSVIAYDQFHQDSYHYLKQQLLAAVFGLMGLFAVLLVPYRYYRAASKWLLLLALGLLLLVYTPMGYAVKNVSTGQVYRRWIRVAGFTFQPVEFVKLALIVYIADFLSRRWNFMRSLSRGVLPSLLVLSIYFVLIYKQPDFGSALLIAMVVLVMLFVGGARMSQIFLVAAIAVLFLYLVLQNEADYRLKRILDYLFSNPSPQIEAAQRALSIGGIMGTGLGNSLYKLYRLPFAHTDFIFAVIGEELGLIGTGTIVILYMLLVWRGLFIALRVRDTFGSALAVGISALFGFQTLVNVGVVTRLLPAKGLTLPFISYGGSSLMMSLIFMGILLNVSRSLNEPQTQPVWGK